MSENTFNKGDKFTFGTIGGVVTSYQSDMHNYYVEFDGQAGKLTMFTTEFFEAHAEPIKPTPQERYRAMPVGTRFQFVGEPDESERVKLNDEFYALLNPAGGRPRILLFAVIASVDIEEVTE